MIQTKLIKETTVDAFNTALNTFLGLYPEGFKSFKINIISQLSELFCAEIIFETNNTKVLRYITQASINAQVIQVGRSKVRAIFGGTNTGSFYVLKLYDMVGIPNPAVDIPKIIVFLSNAYSYGVSGFENYQFVNGLAMVIVGAINDNSVAITSLNGGYVNIVYE